MRKTHGLMIFVSALLITIASVSLVSAGSYYYDDSPSWYSYTAPSQSAVYSTNTHYEETPALTVLPKIKSTTSAKTSYKDTNYDSTDSRYDYRGPLYEKKTVYQENLLVDKSSKSKFLYSKNNDILQHSITNTVTEKYVGATESLYQNTQNRRTTTADNSQNSNYDYNGGFSWGQARVFDSSEYADDIQYGNYYYRPYYNGDRYIWNY